MALDTLRLILLALKHLLPYAFTSLLEQCKSIIHKRAYRAVSNPKNIIVVGGSFAGVEIAKKLANSIPTGYRVVLIEKNDSFNYTFNFPRYCVLKGREKLAFIPYDQIARKGVPRGSLEIVRRVVDEVKEGRVMLDGGRELEYSFLVLATGCASPQPAKMSSSARETACGELREYQNAIKEAESVIIVGGGAVGVELVADVKSYYPGKRVTLVHSRERLLNRFGQKLHKHVKGALEGLGVEVLLSERPEILYGDAEKRGAKATSLRFADGRVVNYDVVIPCTGQKPQTHILSSLAPSAISPTTGRVLVHPTLQILTQAPNQTNIFALGDVAETHGPKMARAAFFQASIVQRNIMAMIRGKRPRAVYEPQDEIEGSLKLTLGKSEVVIYCQPKNGDEILLTSNKGKDDLDVERAWKAYGGDIREAKAELGE